MQNDFMISKYNSTMYLLLTTVSLSTVVAIDIAHFFPFFEKKFPFRSIFCLLWFALVVFHFFFGFPNFVQPELEHPYTKLYRAACCLYIYICTLQ